MKRSFAACIVALAMGAASASRATIPITDCGQTVPANEKGVLQNDVQCEFRCTGDRPTICTPDGHLCEDEGKGFCDVEWVTLERGAILDLDGHQLGSAWHAPAVICGTGDETGRCVVKGPGIVWGGTHAIQAAKMAIVAKDVTLHALYDAARTAGRVTITNAVLESGSVGGVFAGGGLKLKNVDAGQAEEIFSGGDIELDHVQLGPSTLNYVMASGTVRGRDVLLRGDASIEGRTVVLRRATSVAGAASGEIATVVHAHGQLRLVDSDVFRIASGKFPHLVRSACNESLISGTSSSWGVCSSDARPSPTPQPLLTPPPTRSCMTGPNPGPTSCDFIH